MTNFQFSLPVGFKRTSTLIVAVSGGSDSIAILHLLSLQQGLSFKRLIAAHVNYGLRGAQSQADELMVRRLCAQWRVPLRILRVKNLKSRVRREKLNLQEEARRIRYSFFASVAQKEKAWGVAVAHHLEDQAETVLDRFLRGSGAKGLSGLRRVQSLSFGKKSLQVWRPLLNLSKDELRTYLKECHVPWREDRSNQRVDYRRNQLRHQALPFLGRWNPNLVRSLSRMGEVAAAEDQFLEEWAGAQGARLKGKWTAKSYSCSAKGFAKEPLAFQRRWVRQVAERLNPDARGLSFERVELLLRVWSGKEKGPRDLGYGLSVERGKDQLHLRNVGVWRRA